MSKQERFYESLIKESPIAYAYHKMIYDAFGNPVDYEFIDVNAAFEKMTSLNASDIIGKKLLKCFQILMENHSTGLRNTAK